MRDSHAPITELLEQWRAGDASAVGRLLPLVYDELRHVAARRMRAEADGHTLQPTELVHEAYHRLAGAELALNDRAHFFALASETMRRVLVDHAKARTREKRGGVRVQVTLHEESAGALEQDEDLLELDRCLQALHRAEPRKARIVELVYFAGLTQTEVATVLALSVSTVERELRTGKAWLASQLR
jgi:RNA polymerase sigma factor (TIGR02999 family)